MYLGPRVFFHRLRRSFVRSLYAVRPLSRTQFSSFSAFSSWQGLQKNRSSRYRRGALLASYYGGYSENCYCFEENRSGRGVRRSRLDEASRSSGKCGRAGRSRKPSKKSRWQESKKEEYEFFALHEDAAEVERDFINQRINIVNNPLAVNDLRSASTSAGGNLPRDDDLQEVPGDAGSVTSTGPVDNPL